MKKFILAFSHRNVTQNVVIFLTLESWTSKLSYKKKYLKYIPSHEIYLIILLSKHKIQHLFLFIQIIGLNWKNKKNQEDVY